MINSHLSEVVRPQNLNLVSASFSTVKMKVLYASLTFLTLVFGLGQNAVITLKKDPKLLQLAGQNLDSQILVSPNDWWGVLRAAEDLALDFGKVTGKNVTLGSSKQKSEPILYEYREPTSNTNVSILISRTKVIADHLEVHNRSHQNIYWSDSRQ